MKLQLNKNYITATTLLLIIEVLIAIYLKAGFIRHTFGDFLATILLFSFFKSFIKINSIKLGIVVLIIAFVVEFAQLIGILELLNIKNNVIKIILGTSFEFSDLVAYSLGTIAIVLIDLKLCNHE